MTVINSVAESDLRSWVRKTWGKGGHGLDWVEPTAGSSVGVPDVMIPIFPRLVPAELKVNRQSYKSRNFLTPVRPAQIRYHQSMADSGLMSVYVVAHGEKDDFSVWITPGYKKIWEEASYTTEKVELKSKTGFYEKILPAIGDYLVAQHQNKNGMKNRERFETILKYISQRIYPVDSECRPVHEYEPASKEEWHWERLKWEGKDD